MSAVEFQRCRDCGRDQNYPRALCKHCGSRALEVVEGSGRGTVFATTVVHRSSREELATPYGLTLVRMEEGPMLMALIVGEAEEFPAGAAVAVDAEATRERGLLTVGRRCACVRRVGRETRRVR
jgi:uncharacterized protein